MKDFSELRGPFTEPRGQFSGENASERLHELKSVRCRRLFDGLPVDATDGIETFHSSRLFTGGVYGQPVPLAARGKPRSASKASVEELSLDSTSLQIFGPAGVNRPRWSEAQVAVFCRTQRELLRLQPPSAFCEDFYACNRCILFELEGGVVSSVRVAAGGLLDMYMNPLGNVCVWHAHFQHRVVILGA